MLVNSSPEEPMELRSKAHCVDQHGVVAIEVEHADLQERPVGGWSDEQGEVILEGDSPDGVTCGVQNVFVRDPVPPRWLSNPHGDNICCLPDGSTS
jgi:hypothetical protein